MTQDELVAQLVNDPTNPDAAIALSRNLRQTGSYDDATSVLMRAYVQFPTHAGLLGEFGKVFVEQGDPETAVRFLEKSVMEDPRDWTVYSALGVALDQTGNHYKAQEKYRAALAFAPNEPAILINLGLSYAMAGDLKSARHQLTKAAEHPNAPAAARNNLALIVGLEGDFEQARQIAGQDLPKPVADQNISYLKSILSQPNRWQTSN